ncbi:MAG: HEPN domain-containing protein [Chitinophagaceae bacterium]|nr:HEPN domain-containing protein [Chitinophagaceae bacterium]
MNDARLKALQLKLQNKFYATVINRLYYSCFHATKALLLLKDLTPKTHSGVVAMLNRHFVQSGDFDMMQASFYSRLMQERINEDYSDEIIEDPENAKELIVPARQYVAYIETLIQKLIAE